MDRAPLVTVGISSYNRPDDLRAAILSIQNQSYSNIEILISDNGSTKPGPQELIRKFAGEDERIRTFFHKKNQGPFFNFEYLLSQATGKYFVWLADDDRFKPNFIEDCVQHFNDKPGIVLSGNMPVILNENKQVSFKYVPSTIGLTAEERYKLVIRHVFSDLNLFFYSLIDMEALRKCSLYLKRVHGSDTFLLMELLNFGALYIDQDKTGFEYQLHATQTSSSALFYKKMVVNEDCSYVERKWFFTAPLFYGWSIIFAGKELSVWEKVKVAAIYINYFVSSKKFHLIKYDLGLHGVIQRFKKLAGGKAS